MPFSFEDAEKVELKGTFITQADFVFLNISMRGYKPAEDVRFALSSDELVLEVRDRTATKGINRIKRTCLTLSKQIDVPTSEVQLLVDFIVVKLSKQEKGV